MMEQRIAAAERAVESAQLELASLRSEAAQQQGQHRAAVQRLEGSTATAESVLEALRSDGAVVLERLAPDRMDAVQQELAALEPFAHRCAPRLPHPTLC